ncbi:hypothetical protein C1H46_029120 [Malus baccata]|uniref:Uncharacterized protein n=1 Tax=Malus baccata TaxID=106549 RepID=A0A540LFS8_MALBA|nr:hypothetical protein C1H46_029120 [Malus baccata]
MADHTSSERWIEIVRGRSGDLSAIAADPRFHESGRGGTVRKKHGGPSGPVDPARTTQTGCACAVDDRGSQRHPDCNIESSLILIPKSSPPDLSSGKKEPTGLRLDDKREEITLTKPKQATLIEAFYLQITSNNLIKVPGGIMRIHYRIGVAQQDREIWRGARGLAEGGLGASRLGYQDGVWVGLAVGHMGEGGDALRTHEAAQTLRMKKEGNMDYIYARRAPQQTCESSCTTSLRNVFQNPLDRR